MKKRCPLKYAVCFALAVCLVLSSCSLKNRKIQGAVFSWDKEEVTDNPEELFEFAVSHEFHDIYQHFSGSLTEEEITSFMTLSKEHECSIYMLTGEPEWGIEEDASHMLSELDRVRDFNEKNAECTFSGIVYDVEPYLLEEWDKDSKKVMNDFAENLEATYEKAKSLEIFMAVCIPYYYDTKGHDLQLEEIVKNCDMLIVMNYWKGEESEHIETEAKLCAKYGKILNNAYELQAPESHGLIEENTYYNDGMEAVFKNFKEMFKTYDNIDFRFSIHDYPSAKEVENAERSP